jgi:hypothetical protein
LKYDDRGLREMLRLAAEGVEGLLMRQVPGKESELDRAIFEDVQRNRSFRFKEATGAFADAPIRFDAVYREPFGHKLVFVYAGHRISKTGTLREHHEALG